MELESLGQDGRAPELAQHGLLGGIPRHRQEPRVEGRHLSLLLLLLLGERERLCLLRMTLLRILSLDLLLTGIPSKTLENTSIRGV
jgi:hypothetical protein